MQLLELSLHNYKVHRKKTLKFEPGVVGIVGDNGSGKSSIISAICFLFTGEVDTPTKRECLTLGETEGWVKGKFSLNGKEGVLERHLNSSKVVLTYDDVTYNKVSEVNQLWNDLLKIDSTIFNNVIVAKQGEIQNLFSDETTVREKIFQKIFMVPNTEKIRSVIWDNYIKVCPPEKPAEDVQQLINLQVQVAKERNGLLQEVDLKTAQVPDDTLLRCINDRVSFLERCNTDLTKKPEFEQKLIAYAEEQRSNDASVDELKRILESLPALVDLNNRKNKLLENRASYTRKQSLLKEIAGIKVDPTALERENETAAGLDILKNEQHELVTELNTKLKDVVTQKNHNLQLRGHAVCPTCHQNIPDVEGYIKQLMADELDLKARFAKANANYQSAIRISSSAYTEIAKIQSLVQRKAYLEDEVNKLGDVHYSEAEFVEVSQSIVAREAIQVDLQETLQHQKTIDFEMRVLKEKLNNLAIYDGQSSAAEELVIYQAALRESKEIQTSIAALELQAGKLEHELLLLNTRISVSEVNSVYNKKRKQYLDKLLEMHEIFHVSKFPRKLIETYLDHIQSSLSTYLDYFDLPYTVKVTEGFKIRLYNGETDPLPQVSGGQEMMLGICLRLALHKMFAKAFPIWIIDEGTTHLSESKKQNYFELINELRNQRIINQIIIIDHDERLSTVVDQTIQL